MTTARRALAALAATAALALGACSSPGPAPGPAADWVLPEGAGFQVGDPDAEVVLEVHSDPQCPWCARFEEAVGPQIAEQVEAGESSLRVVLRSFLDERTGGEASEMAASAVLCSEGPEQALDYFSAMMLAQGAAEQPLGAQELVDVGEGAGLDADDLRACIDDGSTRALVQEMESAAVAAGVEGTPRLFVNDRQVPQELMGPLLEGQVTLADLTDVVRAQEG